jgi:patatin-like phospholipase
MATDALPLHVADVLEEEFELLHSPLPRSEDRRTIRASDIRSDALLLLGDERSALRERLLSTGWCPPGTIDHDAIATHLSRLVDGEVLRVTNTPWLTNVQGRTKFLAEELGRRKKQPNAEEIRRINRQIVDETFPELVYSRTSHVIDAIHELDPPRTALCISGGGIRSATFALGVVEGLAHYGILGKFDYLSTVSGGGYIGSWLSTWIKRHFKGLDGVQSDLDRERANGKPEARPLRHLREYSNYLVPRLGIFSADTWAVVATYVRNLLLNWLVLVPLIAFVLGLSRGHEALLLLDSAFLATHWGWTLSVGGIFAVVAGCYLGAQRPVTNQEVQRTTFRGGDGGFVWLCLAPSIIFAVIVTTLWAGVEQTIEMKLARVALYAILACAALALFAWLIYAWRLRRTLQESLRNLFFELVACIISAVATGALMAWLATWLFPKPIAQLPPNFPDPLAPSPLSVLFAVVPTTELYVIFAVPLVLLALYVQGTLFVGLASALNEDYDREWWARGAGWFVLGALAWAAIAAISLFGPIAFYHAPAILGSIGGVSGLIAVMAGKSGTTSGANKEKETESKTGLLANIALALAAPLFVVILLAAISLLTTTIVNAVADYPDDEARQASFKSQFVSWSEGEYAADSLRKLPDDLKSPPLRVMRVKTAPQPMNTMAAWRSWVHLRTLHHHGPVTFWTLLALTVVGIGLSAAFGVNRFSMHAFYRNRLIRAYLGASRYDRHPNGFTGFDKNDNVRMWVMRPDFYDTTNLLDLGEVIKKLQTDKTAGSLLERLPHIASLARDPKKESAAAELLTDDLNALIEKKKLYRGDLDRLLQPCVVPRDPQPRLFHVINIALNLVSGKNLAFQERMAESFTVSPLHCGSYDLGYRDSREYGHAEGISIGTAVTISGAAASPNMGYHSSPAVAALLTAFNVRLGSWLGNPGVAGARTYMKHEPRPAIGALLKEVVGATDDEYKWVYLSDGGHFENLGFYEMVMRRCRYIIISDGGCDPEFTFEDLGNAIRKIYIDFGIPVSIDTAGLLPRDDEREIDTEDESKEPKYFACGTIDYQKVDGPKVRNGCFIYVKPSFHGTPGEPKDVFSYAKQNKAFPHEPTADQFFSESQFESYRRLGRFALDQIVPQNNRNNRALSVEQFFEWADCCVAEKKDKSATNV